MLCKSGAAGLAQISKRVEDGVLTKSDSRLLGEASESVRKLAVRLRSLSSDSHFRNDIRADSIMP